MNRVRLSAAFATLALMLVAWLAPTPDFLTDRPIYEQMSRQWFIPNCDDLQCFRVGVPWMLGLFPGDGYLKWRLYAIVCQALAGLLMAQWVKQHGASERAQMQVLWLTALGAGALYTLFDPFTADPLMHLAGPALMVAIGAGRLAAALPASIAGVLAKEFAAVPLAVSALMRAQERRWNEALRLGVAALVTIAVWGAWNLYLRRAWGYSTIHSHSAELLSGGFIVFWLGKITPVLAATAIASVFGGLWLLWPAGVAWGGGGVRRLALAAAGPLLVFNYVQQPDRALWNFAFVVMPAAAIVLDRVPAALGWTLVALQILVNLRMGAQLPFVPGVRITLTAALIVAAAAVWRARTPVPSLVREHA